MKLPTMVVVLVAACNTPTPPAPTTQAMTPPATTPAKPETPAPTRPETAPPKPAATCIPRDAAVANARLEDGVLVACYAKDKVDECWRFDPVKSAWSFEMRRPHVDASPDATVTATATSARACASDGSDCKTIPLTGIVTAPDDVIAGSANLDRSIIAVWASGPIHVFDDKGKRLTTIKPWPTPMSGGTDPAIFRQAHVLGSTIAVQISDTPVSVAIRLYDVRGKKIADVFGGKPMEDFNPPLALGNSRYAFISFDTPRSIVIVDVATGKQLGTYPAGDALTSTALLRGPDDNVMGVIGPKAVRIDLATRKLTTVAAPICP